MVSWKDDAEMNDSVESDALVMPRSSGSAIAGLAAALDDPLVLLLEDVLLDLLVDQEVRVAHVLDAHAAQHLTNDDLDVLVVDARRPGAGRPPGFRPRGTAASSFSP